MPLCCFQLMSCFGAHLRPVVLVRKCCSLLGAGGGNLACRHRQHEVNLGPLRGAFLSSLLVGVRSPPQLLYAFRRDNVSNFGRSMGQRLQLCCWKAFRVCMHCVNLFWSSFHWLSCCFRLISCCFRAFDYIYIYIYLNA